MNLIPDEENWKDKLTKFMNTKGFYIILAVCILFVAATVIFVKTQNGDSSETKMNGESGMIIPDEASNVQQEEQSKAVAGPVQKTESANQATAEKDPANVEKATEKTENVKPKTSSTSSAVKFERPVDGAIMKDFTRDIHTFSESKTLGDIRAHNGIDFKVDKLTKVRAVADGTVCLVENDPSGITVEISHGSDGLKTKYAGLSKQGLENVSVGLKVKANEIIGLVGDPIQSECADGAHLHFEVLKNGKSVDPVQYLKTPSTTSQQPK